MPNDLKGHLLVVDDEPLFLNSLSRLFGMFGFMVETANNPEDGLAIVARNPVDAALIDLMMPGMTGIECMKRIKAMHVDIPVIIMTAEPSIERALDAVREGAYDFLQKPLSEPEKVLILIERAIEHCRLKRDNESLRREVNHRPDFDNFIGRNPKMLALFAEIRNYAWSNGTVLVLGESGTGKELVAKAIHRNSPRAEKRFGAVAAPNFSSELFESTVFGHVRGAFSGAHSEKAGLIEELDGGTLFLDEIGDIPESIQPKLLRFLSLGEFSRVGELGKTRKADVRIVAATNVDLDRAVVNGKFRHDLLNRLSVFKIEIPPLRRRSEDIPHLAYYFLRTLAQKEKRDVRQISVEGMDILKRCSWTKGNVRQLENAMLHAVVCATSDTIVPDDLPAEVKSDQQADPGILPSNYPYTLEVTTKDYRTAKKRAEEHFARFYFGELLTRCSGIINRAAKDAGMDPPNLRKKLKEINLDPNAFRSPSDLEDDDERGS